MGLLHKVGISSPVIQFSPPKPYKWKQRYFAFICPSFLSSYVNKLLSQSNLEYLGFVTLFCEECILFSYRVYHYTLNWFKVGYTIRKWTLIVWNVCWITFYNMYIYFYFINLRRTLHFWCFYFFKYPFILSSTVKILFFLKMMTLRTEYVTRQKMYIHMADQYFF